jgi:GT2 family glycosyltransferase
MFRLAVRSCQIIIEKGWAAFFKKIQWRIKRNWFQNTQPILKVRGDGFKAGQPVSRTLDEFPPIDIIVVTYNSANYISGCIESILASQYPKDKISLIIVDNDSTDDTKLLLRDLQLKLDNLDVISSRNVGYGAAINLAFKSSAAKYVLILNPDTKLKADTLMCLVNAAMETEQEGFCAWEARQQPYEHPKLYDPVTLEPEWVSGACVLILREAFEKASGFDERIFLYGEDVDLSWRMRALGYRLQYVPSAVLFHMTYADTISTKPTQFFNSIISNGILRFKHGGFKDIAAYNLGILAVLLKPPRRKNVRLHLLLSLFTAIPTICRVLVSRAFNRNQLPATSPRFDGWNYEIRRRGAFYVTKARTQDPLVSLIVRTIQRPHFLREALQSIRNQTYRPLEIIIVEDGAPVSEQFVRQFSDLNIRYRSTASSVGRSRAGNLGLSLATGKYINFLDDDDLLFADHVEVLVGELESDRSRLAAYSIGFEVRTRVLSIDPFIYEETSYGVVYEQPYSKNLLTKANYIPINSIMFSRELFLKQGGFDEALNALEDWDLWLRYSKYTDFMFVEKSTCLYRVPSEPEVAALRQQTLDESLRIKRQQENLPAFHLNSGAHHGLSIISGKQARKKAARGARVRYRRQRITARQASAEYFVMIRRGISAGWSQVLRLRSKWLRTI